MNRDRFEGAAENLTGRATSAAGTLIGSDQMIARGNTYRATGRVRNIIGSIWEALGLKGNPPAESAAFVRQASELAEATIFGKDTSMNENEIKGGLRDVKGKIEKAVGDATTDTKWQADGIIDQVAGSAQKAYGQAKDKVQDVVADAPDALVDAKERVKDVASRGRAVANDQLHDNPWVLVAAAGIAGYALSWVLHGRRD